MTANTGNTLGRVVSSENGTGSDIALASGPIPSSDETNDTEPADIHAYCASLAGTSPQGAALAKICEFALSVRKNLPDVICKRETKRYWKTFADATPNQQASKLNFDDDNHTDVIVADVRYSDGQEHDDHFRINGRPADASAPWSSGAWSVGEFALSLNTIFAPSSKPEFHYVKEEKLHSTRATVFDFHVSAQNNKSYYLTSGGQAWFPEYHGRIWIDEGSFSLLKLERETVEMPGEPIWRMKTETKYSMIALGDGAQMVLPIHSDVLICPSSAYAGIHNCARNIVTFSKWQKFRATTKLVADPN